jgi:Putative Actinobacterial Holin-X, holin superfamily III
MDMTERDRETATLERQSESLPSLFGRLTDELTQLFDAKLDLLKAELKQEAGAYAVGAGLILIGVVIATVGFALLNVAIAFFVSMLFEATQWTPAARYGVGFVITALLYLIVGAVIAVIAKNRLAKERVAPKSAAELKRDKEFLKEQF